MPRECHGAIDQDTAYYYYYVETYHLRGTNGASLSIIVFKSDTKCRHGVTEIFLNDYTWGVQLVTLVFNLVLDIWYGTDWHIKWF